MVTYYRVREEVSVRVWNQCHTVYRVKFCSNQRLMPGRRGHVLQGAGGSFGQCMESVPHGVSCNVSEGIPDPQFKPLHCLISCNRNR